MDTSPKLQQKLYASYLLMYTPHLSFQLQIGMPKVLIKLIIQYAIPLLQEYYISLLTTDVSVSMLEDSWYSSRGVYQHLLMMHVENWDALAQKLHVVYTRSSRNAHRLHPISSDQISGNRRRKL